MTPEASTDADAIRRDLAASRARLLASISGVTEEQFKKRPSEGGRCIAELLALQLVSEKLRSERIRLALTHDGAEVELSDPEEQAKQARLGRIAPVPQLIHGLLAARREIGRLLDEAAALDGGLERAILHPREGRQTVGFLIRQQVAAQENAFVDEIEALKAWMAATSAAAADAQSPPTA